MTKSAPAVKMTASDLKNRVSGTGSFFFTRDTMKFFGDTMANYNVRSKPVTIVTASGVTHECWALYRRRAVKYGMKDDAYFDVVTFERILQAK